MRPKKAQLPRLDHPLVGSHGRVERSRHSGALSSARPALLGDPGAKRRKDHLYRQVCRPVCVVENRVDLDDLHRA